MKRERAVRGRAAFGQRRDRAEPGADDRSPRTTGARPLAPTEADVAYLRAIQRTLSEWDSPEDDAAYADL